MTFDSKNTSLECISELEKRTGVNVTIMKNVKRLIQEVITDSKPVEIPIALEVLEKFLKHFKSMLEQKNEKEVHNMTNQNTKVPTDVTTESTPKVKKATVASIIAANKDKPFEEIKKIVKEQRPDVADNTIKIQYNRIKKS